MDMPSDLRRTERSTVTFMLTLPGGAQRRTDPYAQTLRKASRMEPGRAKFKQAVRAHRQIPLTVHRSRAAYSSSMRFSRSTSSVRIRSLVSSFSILRTACSTVV